MRPGFFLALPAFLFAACSDDSSVKQKTAPAQSVSKKSKSKKEDIRVVTDPDEFTDRHFRVVWSRPAGEKNGDAWGNHGESLLMGYDSEDGKGARPLREAVDGYRRPMITDAGDQVVWTDMEDGSVWKMNWDGSGATRVAAGYALETMPTADGRVWCYAAAEVLPPDLRDVRKVSRFPLEAPDEREVVWDATDIAFDNFQFARSGRNFASLFPWPDGGVTSLGESSYRKYARGCWTSMCPDDSGLFWIFDGPHMNLRFYAAELEKNWTVPVNATPEMRGHEVYHPRWSNAPHYFAITGPYTTEADGLPAVFSGGTNVETYVGRFREDFSAVDVFFQVTDNEIGDFYPDVWIAGGEGDQIDLAAIAADKPHGLPAYAYALEGWPAKGAEPVFVFDNGLSANELDLNGEKVSCKLEIKDRARYGPNWELDLGGGRAMADGPGAQRILKAMRDGESFSMEFVLHPHKLDYAETRPFLSIGTASDGPVFEAVIQTNGQAGIRYRNGAGKELGPIQGNGAWLAWKEPVLITVVCRKGKIQIYREGTGASNERVPLDRQSWPQNLDDAYVILGSPESGLDWEGRLEKFAFYPHDLEDQLVDASSDMIRKVLKERSPIPQVEFEGTLLEVAPVPTPESIAPYKRALVAHRYKVDKIHSGELNEEEVVVLHYALMDGKVLGTFPRSPGSTNWIRMEPFDRHTQLEPERRIEIEGYFGDLWYDVFTPYDQWEK